MVDTKTIRIKKGTKKRLDKIKKYERETYDEILVRLLNQKNLNKEEA